MGLLHEQIIITNPGHNIISLFQPNPQQHLHPHPLHNRSRLPPIPIKLPLLQSRKTHPISVVSINRSGYIVAASISIMFVILINRP